MNINLLIAAGVKGNYTIFYPEIEVDAKNYYNELNDIIDYEKTYNKKEELTIVTYSPIIIIAIELIAKKKGYDLFLINEKGNRIFCTEKELEPVYANFANILQEYENLEYR